MTGAPPDGSSNGVPPPSATGQESRGDNHAQSAMTQELRNSDPVPDPDEGTPDEEEENEDDNTPGEDPQAPEQPGEEPESNSEGRTEEDNDHNDDDDGDNGGHEEDDDDNDNPQVETVTTPASPAG